MNKELHIIKNPDDQKMFQEIISFLEKVEAGMTPLQITEFVLNDIEFPTPYGKFQQAKTELKHRYSQLVDFYYQLKEKEIQIKIKEKEKEGQKNELRKDLLDLEIEKNYFQLTQIESELKRIISEARVFFNVYQGSKQLDELPPEECFKLEAENWAKKTLNTPTIFEERYGSAYLKKAIGEENYQQYKKIRQQGFGLLPREIFEVVEKNKQLKEK